MLLLLGPNRRNAPAGDDGCHAPDPALPCPALPALSAGLYCTVLPFVLQTFKTKNFEVAQCPGKASTATRSSIKFKQASGWAGRAGSCPAAVVVQMWALSWQTPGTYAGPL